MLSKSEPLAEGTVIMADDQFAGRGQQGNRWLSAAGLNLTFSIYLKPNFLDASKQFFLNMAVSIGISNGLSVFVKKGIKIKWPNDLYFNTRKVGGVLIENTLSGATIKSSIIGIGINVNQRQFHAEHLNNASSLSQILQQDVDLISLLNEICHAIEVQYLLLRSGTITHLHQEYLENLYQFGKLAMYKKGDRFFEGTIINVSPSGQLLMQTEGGERAFNFKEIEFFNKN